MNLKEELAKLEEEEIEEEQDEIELIREQETRDKITGLYRRIAVIVEYIDKTEEDPMQQFETLRAKELGLKNGNKNEKELTIEETRLRELEYELNEKLHHMYDTGFEAGVNYTMKRVKKKREESASREYVKGYEDGVKAISEFIKDDTDKFPDKDVIDAIQKALSIKVPSDLASLISKTQVQRGV